MKTVKNTHIIKSFIIIGLIMGILDYIYLSSISNMFKKMLYRIQSSNLSLKLVPTILCYIFLIFSILYFIIIKNGNILDAFILGISIYAVYELTNYATIESWSLELVLIDTIWGGILFSLTTFLHNKIV